MGTTQGGLPWPAGTELVRDGDNAIRALAEAADNIVLSGRRTTGDAVGSGQWGVMCHAEGQMPSGNYLVIAVCIWNAENQNASAYCWLNATFNGIGITAGHAYGGWQSGDNWISHTFMNVLRHNGGNMVLDIQFGFANQVIAAQSGSQITAVRLGP